MLRVEYETVNRKNFTEGIAFSKNLSDVGICVIMPDKLPKNCKLDLAIHLPNKKKALFAKSKVVWQTKCATEVEAKRKYYITGIQFKDMSVLDAIKESDFVKGILIQRSERENRAIINKLEKLYNVKD